MIYIIMLKRRLDSLEKQHGGAIPFSALASGKNSKKKSLRKSPRKHTKKKKKRSVSPSRIRRRVTKKTTRTKKRTIREKKSKKCSCGSKTYTGKEETPRGLGKCEECVPLKIVLRGRDDKLYENRKGGWFKLT